jgi:DNA-directed RNA polymerase subunit RPC12/RpoP
MTRTSVRPTAAPAPAPGLKILVAGVDKDSKGAVEAAVRQGLGPRAASGPWSVSVVSLAGKWSVTLDGPDDRLRGVSFMADQSRLAAAIREVVDGGPPAVGAPPPPVAAPAASGRGEVREQHACERCGKAVLVIYESQPDEAKEQAPLACPHCWSVGHVAIGAWAAAGGDYRSEKA